MATFAQNIRKIRGEAIYGPEMRTAIAEAIQQTMNLDIEASGDMVLFDLIPIQDTPGDYTLEIKSGD